MSSHVEMTLDTKKNLRFSVGTGKVLDQCNDRPFRDFGIVPDGSSPVIIRML